MAVSSFVIHESDRRRTAADRRRGNITRMGFEDNNNNKMLGHHVEYHIVLLNATNNDGERKRKRGQGDRVNAQETTDQWMSLTIFDEDQCKDPLIFSLSLF